MARLAPFRRTCSDAISWHQDEAMNATIYILREIGPTGFLLKEENETKKVKVLLGDPHSCTCSKFQREKELCKHICWVLLKKFRLPRESQLSWQKGLVEREINEVLHQVHVKHQRSSTQVQPSARDTSTQQNGAGGTPDDGTVAQRPINDEDVCPICMEEFTDKRDPVTYCRNSCGNNVHIKCMKVWTEHEVSENKKMIRCPYCRESFASLEVLRKEFRNAEGMAANGINKNQVAHYGLVCDKCEMFPIMGKCYRCCVCGTICLCQACFNTPTHTHHPFEYREKPNQRWRTAQRSVGHAGLPEAVVTNLMNRDISDQDYDTLIQLDSAEAGPAQLSDLTLESINLLPLERVRASSQLLLPGVQCRICFRPFQQNDSVRGLLCQHKFHKDCIDPWLLHRQPKCPVDGVAFSNESIRAWKDNKEKRRIAKLKEKQEQDKQHEHAQSSYVNQNNLHPQAPDMSALQISALGYPLMAERAMQGAMEVRRLGPPASFLGVGRTAGSAPHSRSNERAAPRGRGVPRRNRSTTLRNPNSSQPFTNQEGLGNGGDFINFSNNALTLTNSGIGQSRQDSFTNGLNHATRAREFPLPDSTGVSLLTRTRVNLDMHGNYLDSAMQVLHGQPVPSIPTHSAPSPPSPSTPEGFGDHLRIPTGEQESRVQQASPSHRAQLDFTNLMLADLYRTRMARQGDQGDSSPAANNNSSVQTEAAQVLGSDLLDAVRSEVTRNFSPEAAAKVHQSQPANGITLPINSRQPVPPSIPRRGTNGGGLAIDSGSGTPVGSAGESSNQRSSGRGRLASRPLYRPKNDNQQHSDHQGSPHAINNQNFYIGNEQKTAEKQADNARKLSQCKLKVKSAAEVRSAQEDPYRWGAIHKDRNDLSLAGNKLQP